MSMSIVNKIGFEIEFFLRKGNDLVFPREYGFQCDDFQLLGELRTIPGNTRQDTVGNFFKEIAYAKQLASKTRYLEILFPGFMKVSPELKAETLRRMGHKDISPTRNLYRTDILGLSDDVIEDGKLLYTKISNGLHIHFSKDVVINYLDSNKTEKIESKSILTNSKKRWLIRKLDLLVLPQYDLVEQLKYRKPGYYEDKPWGFEYRSLPMVEKFTNVNELVRLVDFCFSQLELMEK